MAFGLKEIRVSRKGGSAGGPTVLPLACIYSVSPGCEWGRSSVISCAFPVAPSPADAGPGPAKGPAGVPGRPQGVSCESSQLPRSPRAPLPPGRLDFLLCRTLWRVHRALPRPPRLCCPRHRAPQSPCPHRGPKARLPAAQSEGGAPLCVPQSSPA